MFDVLDRRTRLTGNQIKILCAAIVGDALEFFDYFLIGFVLAFLIGPWKLTFGQSATVLMSSGVGAILGAYAWGWLADRIGRRALLVIGLLRVSFFEKGPDYYLHSHAFQVKLSLFVIVALLSIIPTVEFLSWSGALKAGQVPTVSAKKLRQVTLVLHSELLAIVIILLCAAIMARGGWI